MTAPEHDHPKRLRNELLGLMMRHQSQLLAHIYTLVPNWDDAEDVLGEASVVMIEKLDEFEPGTNFMAWASKICYWSARDFRSRCSRSKVIFDEATFELVAHRAEESTPRLSKKQVALQECLERLSEKDREFVMKRYQADGGVETAATQSGRSKQAAYKALARIRQKLYECISQRIRVAEEQ